MDSARWRGRATAQAARSVFRRIALTNPAAGRFVRALHQFDAFADGGMRRDAIEITQLIDAHAESDADFGLGRARNAASDQIIELRLIAEASEDDFGGEAGIARFELRRALQKKVGCIAALLDFAENIEGDLARW